MKSFLTVVKNPLLSKALLIMKLTILLLVFAMHVAAHGIGQERLNLAFKRTEIANILTAIEKQTNYRFLYNDQLRDVRKKINLDVENVNLRQALDLVFHHTALTYQVMQNNLIVIKEDAGKMVQKVVAGKITGEGGAPLSGVSVNVKGTSRGTASDEKGTYSIAVEETDILVFTYVGYEAQEIKVNNRTEINVSMTSTASSLENIVVIGYGTVKKKDLTGSVVSVKGDEVKKIPAANLMESLQGKVAGADIVRTSGGAGAQVMVTLRGNRSITARNDPLYIVDGIQYPNFQDINPADIQSVEVLKDAASTAIYGSRGANGVIIVTTKRGASGKPRINASAYYGISDVAGYPKPMTGARFADLKRQAQRTAGVWNSPADDPKIFSATDLANINSGLSTYWPGLILEKGTQEDYTAGIAAGSDKTKVYFSFDYFKEKGLLYNDYSKRYTLRLNIDQTLANTLKVGVQSQLTYYDQNLRTDNILTVANKVIPYFSPYNTDGTLAKFPGNGNQVNPLFEELPGNFINRINTTRILSTVYAEWKPFNSVTIRSNFGITNTNTRNGSFEDANTITRALATGSISRVITATGVDLLWENIISWQKDFGNHHVDATVVTSYLSNVLDSSAASGTGQLLPGQSFYALLSNPANLNIYSRYIGSKLMSGAFRLNYNYKGKYLLTLTGREDGASQLASNERWSFFPSAAVAWRVIDEPFLQTQNLFSDLKVRVSYGVAGNAAVAPYSTQSLLQQIPFAWNETSSLAYGFNPLAGNPELNWELTATKNFGLDLGLFKNRITGSVDYYDSKTKALLLSRLIPATNGFLRTTQNIGRTRNKGIEITLRTVNIQTRDLTWTSNITFTRNREKIVELVGNQNDIGNSWFIGYPVISFYDYEKTGIWQLKDSTEAKAYGYKPGDIRVKDQNGDKSLTTTNDRLVVGSAVPDYSFGFSNDFRFRSFDVNIYVFARIGQTFVSTYANKFEPNAIENGAEVDYWTPENPTNDYPRPNSNISRASMPFATTLGYKDGSFVKIRNITLGYTLPSKLTEKLHIGSLRWYVSARNYVTFAKVKDYDPEGAGSFDRPLTKLIVTGLTLDF